MKLINNSLITLFAVVLTPVLLSRLRFKLNVPKNKMPMRKKTILLFSVTMIGILLCRAASSVNESLYDAAIGVLLGSILFMGSL